MGNSINVVGSMKCSVREVLAESHIAAVTIALLLLWSLDGLLRAVWPPVFDLLSFVFTAIAIFDIPYHSRGITLTEHYELITAGSFLYSAIASALACWLLSHLVYGAGPIHVLKNYHAKRLVKTNV